RNWFQSIGLDAGPDRSICHDESINLTGSVVDQQIILDNNLTFSWNDGGAGGTFSNYSNYNLNVTYMPPTVSSVTNINLSLIANFPSFLCGGGTVSNQMILTVYPEAIATITSPSIICQGEDVEITGTPNTTVTYNDGTNTSAFPIGASGIAVFSGLAPGTYTLTEIQYTNNPNCPNPINSSVTINEEPLVDAGPGAIICEGDTLNLTGATIGGDNAVGTWTTSGNGTVSGNVYTPGATDICNSPITVPYTNSASDGMCPGVSDSMLVAINQAPTLYARVDQTVCGSDAVTMTASLG